MGFAKIAKIAFAAIAVTVMLTSVASAQPFQKPLRWLGDGFSAGYHRCTPGPDTSYYNPWNAHNSMLISKLPQFQQQSFQSFNLNNLENRPIYQGVPFSVYAAPNRNHHGFGIHGAPSVYDQGSYHNHHGNEDMVESTFEPFEDDQLEEEAEEETAEDFEDDLDQWEDEENEWMDEEEPIEDDSASRENSGQSVFHPASYPQQSETVPLLEGSIEGSSQTAPGESLFNPFPE